MACRITTIPGRPGYAIICGPKQRPRTCSVCKRQFRNVKLCDYTLKPAHDEVSELDGMTAHIEAKTCDAVLCPACAVHQDPDTDYCPRHAAALGIGGRKLRL